MLFSRILHQLGGFCARRPVVSKTPIKSHWFELRRINRLSSEIVWWDSMKGTRCPEKSCYVAGRGLTTWLMIWLTIDGPKLSAYNQSHVCKFYILSLAVLTVTAKLTNQFQSIDHQRTNIFHFTHTRRMATFCTVDRVWSEEMVLLSRVFSIL